MLDREITHVLKTGIDVKTGRRLGRDFSLESLKAEGFDAVAIARALIGEPVEVYRGSLNASLIRVGEVLRPAIIWA